MENTIKSSILNSDSLKNILTDEPLDSINTNLINSPFNLENEIQNKNKEKAKELIKKLLKETLDQRILISERSARNQLITLKNTKDLTLSITKIAIRMSKQVEEKLKRDKEKQQTKTKPSRGNNLKNKKGYSPHKSTASKTTTNFYKSKTPSHYGKNGNMHNKTPLAKLKKDLSKSKSNVALIKNKFSTKTINQNKSNTRRKSLGRKTKSSLNFKNLKELNDYSLDDLHAPSVTSIKTNKTNNLNVSTNSNIRIYKNINKITKKKTGLRQNLDISKDSKMSSNNKNLNVTNNNINININTSSDKNIIINLSKKKNPGIKHTNINNTPDNSEEKNIKRKKTPFNKRTITDTNINIKKREKTVEDEIDDILTMECKLQEENILNGNDPLLILPMKDLDFVPKGLLRKSSMRCDSITKRNYIINKFKILENLELIKFDDNILQFLDMHTLIELKNISKVFHKIVIPYIVTFLKKEKKNIMNIKESLGITNIPQREDLENIVLNKGSKKAMQLLNETLLNQLFKDKKFPSDDIIFIYRIYFQMINHPYSLIAKTDIFKFWEKCKLYFTTEQNGKTGDILLAMINQKKIDFSKNNEYQIYMLTKGHFKKILPNYFSNICGTTGLFVFIIKDILEFMGITPKIKKKENAFWTYSDIIDSIDDKINYLNNI